MINSFLKILVSEIIWWDFKNSTFIALFVVFLCVIVILVILITTYVTLNTREKKYFSSVSQESNSLRIFSIDVKNNIVSYFKRSDISNKRQMNLNDFYSLFHENDAERVKNWILAIISTQDDISPYLEADTIAKGTHHSRFALLRLIAYNPEVAIVHLEMQVLKYLAPKNDDKKHKVNKSLSSSGAVTMGTLTNLVNRSRSTRGYTFSIRFTYVNQLVFSETEEERLMVLRIKDKIYPFVSNKDRFRYLVEINDHELLISDLKIDNRKQAYQLAASIASIVHKEMLLNAYDKFIRLNIGIVENKLFFRDFASICKHAQETSFIASQENRHISFYEKTINIELTEDKNKDIIDSLIKGNKLRYLFRPIVNVKEKKVLGYLQSVKTYGQSFSSYNEMMRYAHSCDKAHELFSSVAKSVIPRFADQVPKAKTPLFYPVSILDFENIEKVLPQITRIEKTHLVLVFDEQEISQNSSHLKELINSLSTLKILGYELCLTLMDKNLLLDVNFYKIFDYFIAGTAMTGELKKNSSTQIALRTLIESLLKFKKPIIATGLEGWASVELMVKSGVNYVSSEAISPSSEMVLPVSAKKFDKLAEFI